MPARWQFNRLKPGVRSTNLTSMALTARRLATLFCLSTALGFAATWSGWLVDSKCYGSLERNKNPSDTLTYVDRDRGQEVRYCHAKSKTTFSSSLPI